MLIFLYQDSTLISTKSGHLHAIDADDWQWWNPCIPEKLRALSNQGYHLVIFSNQGRLTTASGSEAPEAQLFKKKVASILTLLDVPLTIYVACANDIYRKPRIGMWEEMVLKEYGTVIDKGESYFVGDAAGRKKDHSDSDVHFCENLGILFYTPEEFFLGMDGEVTGHKFDPKWYLKSGRKSTVVNALPETPELVVLVGLPGAGKTTYFNNVLRPLGYEHVNGHETRGLESCLLVANQLLMAGKSVSYHGTSPKIPICSQKKYLTHLGCDRYVMPNLIQCE